MTTTAPLNGMRVVDFSEAVPGPFFTRCLADLGADVSKVERPGRDVTHVLQPAVWEALNADKQLRVLDLKDPDDAAAARALAASSDVVVEGFRPGVMQRLGLGYEEVAELNPGVIYVSLSGFGQAGPLAATPGHDLNYLAASGLLAICGETRPSNAIGAPVADLASSMYAATATLAAYIQRLRTGRGQHLDVAIADCLTHWMNVVTPNLRARGHDTIDTARRATLVKPAYGVFQTADGAWVALAALEDKFWVALAEELHLDLVGLSTATRADRVTHSVEINAAIRAALAVLPTAQVVSRLQRRDVPVAVVESPVEVQDSENSRARDLFVERGGVMVARFPVRAATAMVSS